jgi:hypothetical protein
LLYVGLGAIGLAVITFVIYKAKKKWERYWQF